MLTIKRARTADTTNQYACRGRAPWTTIMIMTSNKFFADRRQLFMVNTPSPFCWTKRFHLTNKTRYHNKIIMTREVQKYLLVGATGVATGFMIGVYVTTTPNKTGRVKQFIRDIFAADNPEDAMRINKPEQEQEINISVSEWFMKKIVENISIFLVVELLRLLAKCRSEQIDSHVEIFIPFFFQLKKGGQRLFSYEDFPQTSLGTR